MTTADDHRVRLRAAGSRRKTKHRRGGPHFAVCKCGWRAPVRPGKGEAYQDGGMHLLEVRFKG